MTVLVFSGVLSIPSAVFAEASWYGSLRGGLEVGGGNDASYFDGGSRWGIRGSAEAGEGLTAVYRFEHKISTANASQPGGRLAFAGLSGGFGSVTVGQIWSASFNATGAITDNSNYFGNSETTYRHGSALSWAYSAGTVSFQGDLVSDSGVNTGEGVDKYEFGVTIDVGEIGKVAIAHTSVQNTLTSMATYWVNDATSGEPTMTEATQIMVTYAANDSDVVDGKVTTSGLSNIRFAGGKFRLDQANALCGSAADGADACKTTTAYVSTATSAAADTGTVSVTNSYYNADGVTETPAGSVDEAGHKATHVAVELALGSMTTYLGHSQKKKDGMSAKSKTTHYGVRGPLGDTGMSFNLMGRSKKAADGSKSSPWLAGLSRSLGGGAAIHIEHGNNDDGKSGMTRVGLHVTF